MVFKVTKRTIKRTILEMVLQISSGKFKNGKSKGGQNYRKRSTLASRYDAMLISGVQSRCRANSAPIRQSGPDSGLGLQVKVRKAFGLLLLRSEAVACGVASLQMRGTQH